MTTAKREKALAVSKMYQCRFSKKEIAFKRELWKVLCTKVFQRYISPDSTVVDLGAGYCEFINNIKAGTKYAVDINVDTETYAGPDVTVRIARDNLFEKFEDAYVDVVFASNFFEHIASKTAINDIIGEIHRILRPGGRVLVLQPNIKYLYADYWDFFDHHTPLSHISMCEVLKANNFEIMECFPKFLPYTVKSILPKALMLVKLYLKVPLLWHIFGKQMFIVAKK